MKDLAINISRLKVSEIAHTLVKLL